MTLQEKIAVMQAALRGAQLEYRDMDEESGSAWKLSAGPQFNFVRYEYRVKPEPPKPKEIWVNEYPTMNYVYGKFNKEDAQKTALGNVRRIAVHYREVIEGDK